MVPPDVLKTILVGHSAFLFGKQGGKRADFRGLDLAELKLNGINLSASLMGDAVLRGSELVGCDLSDVDAFCADFVTATLVGCDLRRMDGRGSNFERAKINACDLRNADFRPGKSIKVNSESR
ncbi:MAG: pentapeptide repeat-containing protein, partial [Tagaea sp.]